MNAALYDASKTGGYGGIGWIGALFEQLKINNNTSIELGVLFNSSQKVKDCIDGVTYYAIPSKKPQGIKKWMYYLRNYKKLSHLDYFDEISEIINDFKPDIIHLWGVENTLSSVCHYKKIPVIVHLQGLLCQCYETYYPYKMNEYSFKYDIFSKREWIFNNGINFLGNEMQVRAEIEKKHMADVPAVMGRTEWDERYAKFCNPNIKYFHVDEALRSEFYNSPTWDKNRGNKFIVYSTISETIYKGLDVVLKAADILKSYNYFDFEWRIAGINPNSEFVKEFEKIVGIKCSNVNVKLLGKQSPEQLINGLLESDLYVHPSYIDNSPNSLCEAQYLGVPCCSTNVGGVSSLLQNNVSGRLFSANAPFDMAIAVKDCYDHEDQWRQFADNGMKKAHERHNPENIIKQLMKVYNELAK